ncbi:MAG: FUSC family protein, partial [Burkholderiales bacterium]|nr:FUSC family protein [Burkholderiales bacterium]
MPIPADPRALPVWRALLSHYVANGTAAALGLLLISGAVHIFFGPVASASASVGIICCIPPDQAAPKRGKFWHLLPALVVGVPLFLGVRLLHAWPLALGLLLVPATFVAFLGAAWGKRGLPIAVSAMFALIFSLAVTRRGDSGTPLTSTLAFAGGGAFYLIWATAANALLNARYRVQMLADTLYAAAGLMRAQAVQFLATPLPAQPLGEILRRQAALADQLQAARDIVLESPRTRQRQRLAGILMQVLDLRDHLLACELDLDAVKDRHEQDATLAALQAQLRALADDVDALGDALLAGRVPAPQPRRGTALPLPPLAAG